MVSSLAVGWLSLEYARGQAAGEAPSKAMVYMMWLLPLIAVGVTALGERSLRSIPSLVGSALVASVGPRSSVRGLVIGDARGARMARTGTRSAAYWDAGWAWMEKQRRSRVRP